jgi:SAM-dependent methyltransferase
MERYAAEGVHERVVECMAAFTTRGDVLDVPTGQGSLAEDIEALGFRVFPADLTAENIIYRNGRCLKLDLSEPLPFRDEAMDFVMCVEGIEHLENPFFAIREFTRILKKDGYLVITTPNVMCISSRMRFLLSSHLDHFKYFGPLPEKAKHRVMGYEHGHVTAIFYPQMRYMIEKCKLTIERIEASRKLRKWRLLRAVLKPVIKHKAQRYYSDDPFYVSDTLMQGEVLVFVAKK